MPDFSKQIISIKAAQERALALIEEVKELERDVEKVEADLAYWQAVKNGDPVEKVDTTSTPFHATPEEPPPNTSSAPIKMPSLKTQDEGEGALGPQSALHSSPTSQSKLDASSVARRLGKNKRYGCNLRLKAARKRWYSIRARLQEIEIVSAGLQSMITYNWASIRNVMDGDPPTWQATVRALTMDEERQSGADEGEEPTSPRIKPGTTDTRRHSWSHWG